MYIIQDDYDRACYYAGNYEQSFLVVSDFVFDFGWKSLFSKD